MSGLSKNSQVAKRVVAVGNAEKLHIIINISPSRTGTFPERTGKRTWCHEMTQQHKEKTSATFLEKMKWIVFCCSCCLFICFSTRAPFRGPQNTPKQEQFMFTQKENWGSLNLRFYKYVLFLLQISLKLKNL